MKKTKMMNALIETKDGVTSVIEITGDKYDMFLQLRESGIERRPSDIRISDEEEDDVRVKLYAENEVGQHLARMFDEGSTLEDVCRAVERVNNVRDIIKDEVCRRIVNDEYDHESEIADDIHGLMYECGSVSETYFFPLTAQIVCDDEYDDDITVDAYDLVFYEDDIRKAFSSYTERDAQNMAEYYHSDNSVGDKLLLADWGFRCFCGRLYGTVDVRLTEPLTKDEDERLRDWITGQNSDGLGEGFEQQPIEVGDGVMYVSFWSPGDEYFIRDEREMVSCFDMQM